MNESLACGGQSASGYLGTGGVIHHSGDGNAAPARFSSMQGQFPDAQMFTCTIDLQCHTTDPSGLPVAIAAVATIEWAIKGFFIRRKIDVVGAASISGVAQGCKATVVDNSPSGTPRGIKYTVTAMCAPGMRPGHLPPTYTPSPAAPVPPGGTMPVSVPQSIGVRSVQVTAVSLLPTGTVQAIVHAQYQPTSRPPAPPVPPVDLAVWRVTDASLFLPLPPGTQTIVVENLDPSNAITAGVTFGIDG